MLISKLLIKFSSGDASWIDLKIQNQSGLLIFGDEPSRMGVATEAVITAYVPRITSTGNELMRKLTALGCLCLAIKSNGDRWVLGTDDQPCSVSYSLSDGGKAGSRSGYEITIKCAFGARFQSFDSLTDGGIIAITE